MVWAGDMGCWGWESVDPSFSLQCTAVTSAWLSSHLSLAIPHPSSSSFHEFQGAPSPSAISHITHRPPQWVFCPLTYPLTGLHLLDTNGNRSILSHGLLGPMPSFPASPTLSLCNPGTCYEHLV
jgi:hypothetical protein